MAIGFCDDCETEYGHKSWCKRRLENQALRALGVGRMADNTKAILVSFNRAPTDDELRGLHELLRHNEQN